MNTKSLFAPDVFSQPISPPALDVSDSADAILAGLARHYPNLVDESAKVMRLGGFGINSKNWRVESSTGSYAVKCVPGNTAQASTLWRRAKASETLRRCGVPFPSFIPSINGEPVIGMDGVIWSVQPFIDGRYYDGRPADVSHCAVAISDFAVIATQFDHDVVDKQDEFSAMDASFADLALRDIEYLAKCFGEDVTNDLRDIWPQALEYWQDVVAVPSPVGLFHIDLHPHNILMKSNGQVVFVDWDSLRVCRLDCFIGFAILKLCRQALVLDKESDCLKRFCGALKSTAPSLDRFSIFLKAGITEVMRRMVYILRLNAENNAVWNHIMPVQVSLLREARQMLAQI